MALRRRILWPVDFKNTVVYVCANCNGTCFDVPCIPVVAPPPLGLNFTDGDATPIALHHKSHLLPNLLFAGAALLAASILLLLATYAFHRLRRRRRRRLGPSPAGPLAPPGVDGDDDDDGFFEEGEADHHVWHIRTVGLDEATIRSIAACVYNSKDGLLDDSADCAVCLAELRDQELLRLLPKCGHAFHLPCIDTWLRSHVNCPLCRAPILAPAASADPENPGLSSSTPINTVDSGMASYALVDNTQMDIGSESVQTAPEEEIGSGVDPVVASSSTPSSSELLGNGVEDGLLGNGVEDGLQPVRRSVSMDSSSLAALLLRAELEENSGEEKKEPHVGEHLIIKIRGNQMNASKGTGLPKVPIRMGRSLSSRSGRFFLSRYGRGRNSVLPL